MSDDAESIFEGPAKSIASSNGAGLIVGRPSNEYVASEVDTEISHAEFVGVTAKDFIVVQRFIFDHLDRLEPYLARESMVRIQAPSKSSDKRKSTHARNTTAAAATTASPTIASPTSPQQAEGATAVASAKAAEAGEITSTENLFTQLSYVMRQLGPPAAPVEPMQSKIIPNVTEANSGSGEDMFYDILRRDANRSTDAIAKKAIIYLGGVSREKRPVIYVIARRMQMQYLDMDAVLLHTLRLIEPMATKGFEVFFDLTQFGPANEVPIQWLRQLKRIIPEAIIGNVQAIYWYNVNSYFRKYAKQGNLSLPQRLARRSVFPHSLSDLHEFLASPQADLPPGTVSLDSDNGINVTPV
ncbi:Ras GTPase activating protein ira2, partial [Coemansia sp. RSA 25]